MIAGLWLANLAGWTLIVTGAVAISVSNARRRRVDHALIPQARNWRWWF